MKHAQKPKTLSQRLIVDHPVLLAVGIGVLVFALIALVFWFNVFSGLSSSADFIYSQF